VDGNELSLLRNDAMNDLLKLAIAKQFEKDTKDFKPTTGNHDIDQTITWRVVGTISKKADYPSTPTVDIPLLATLALVLEKSGFMRDKSSAILVEAMTEALKLGEKGADHITERVKDIEAAMKKVREVTQALPKKNKSGPTTVKVTIEEVEEALV